MCFIYAIKNDTEVKYDRYNNRRQSHPSECSQTFIIHCCGCRLQLICLMFISIIEYPKKKKSVIY